MNTFNLAIICVTIIFTAAIAGSTIEKIFRIIYEDPKENTNEK